MKLTKATGNLVQGGGFNWSEFAHTRDGVEARRRYRKLGPAAFDLVQFSDARKPFVCLWSDDPTWLKGMRRIIETSRELKEVREAYDLDEVRIEVLPLTEPTDKIAAMGRKLTIQELFPQREVLTAFALYE